MKKMLSTTAAAFFIASNVYAAPMTLNVHNSDLRSTIIMVARAGGLNISVDDSVDGKISMTLNETEPEKILEIIAKTKGLNLVRDGSIYIMTANLYRSAAMKSYVLPIKFGDAKILRKAVIQTLDIYDEINNATLTDNSTGNLNSDRNTNLNYKENNEKTFKSQNSEKDSREDRVLISKETNSLILFGTEAEYERARNLLANLDVELKQVSVEAKILAIDKSASKNLGIDWLWSTVPQYPDYSMEYHAAKYDNFGNQTLPAYIEEKYTRQSNDTTGHGIIQFGRGPLGIPFEFYYGARINALVTDGKAKILSRPNITTVQGKEAVINIGSSVPVPKESVTNSTTTTSIEYRDAGIILKYTPRVNADGTITATIHTEVSTPQYVEDLKAYRFNTRSADTTVTVRDGEPMVIGGLIGAEDGKSVSKIPFLGDLPILGALFRSHKKNKSESELLIFITAHVINGAGVGVPQNVRYSTPAGG